MPITLSSRRVVLVDTLGLMSIFPARRAFSFRVRVDASYRGSGSTPCDRLVAGSTLDAEIERQVTYVTEPLAVDEYVEHRLGFVVA